MRARDRALEPKRGPRGESSVLQLQVEGWGPQMQKLSKRQGAKPQHIEAFVFSDSKLPVRIETLWDLRGHTLWRYWQVSGGGVEWPNSLQDSRGPCPAASSEALLETKASAHVAELFVETLVGLHQMQRQVLDLTAGLHG